MLQDDLIENFPDEVITNIKKDGCYIYPPWLDSYAKCFTVPVGEKMIAAPLNIIEKHLYNYLKNKLKVTPIKDIPLDTKKYGLIIGCDGANSYVGKNILKCKTIDYPKTWYGLIVLFDWDSTPNDVYNTVESIDYKYPDPDGKLLTYVPLGEDPKPGVNPIKRQDRYRGFRTRKK